MTIVEQLRQEYATKTKEATDLIEAAAAAKKDPTAEEQATIDGHFSRLEQIEKSLDQHAKFAAKKLKEGDAVTPGTAPGEKEFNASQGKDGAGDDAAEPKIDRSEFGRAATSWLVTGEMPKKFATITTATGSGVLLPRQITAPIVPQSANAFRQAHTLNGVLPVETGKTDALTIPVLDATGGGVVAENASSETENTPSLAESINLNTKTYQSGSVWFSNQQLAATEFDLLGSTLPTLTFSKELGLEGAIAAAMIADAGITQTVTTAGITSAGLTYGKLSDLNRRLPKRYDFQKAMILSADAFKAAEQILGSDGHPVLVLDPQNQGLVRFNGTPVLRSDFFEAFGATKCVGVVISLLGFRLRDVTVQNLARYVNVPSRPNQTGLNLFAYHGYGWAPSAVAKLVTSAS